MQQQNDFFERVYEVVRQIPFGKVTTYGSIAAYLGAAKSARTVGYAMNAAHAKPDVPAHRVVNRIGLLTGKHHFGGIGRRAARPYPQELARTRSYTGSRPLQVLHDNVTRYPAGDPPHAVYPTP